MKLLRLWRAARALADRGGAPGPWRAALEAASRRRRTAESLSWRVPFSDFSARWELAAPELAEELERVFALRTESERDEYVDGFADAFARSRGQGFGLGLSSGTSALALGLRGLGLRPGDEVIVPAYSFAATALAVLYAGARPVFADVAEGSPHLDLSAAQALRGPRTRALLLAHLFGGIADPRPAADWCREEGLLLIEDACQAHHAASGGSPAGSFGDAAAFSFNYLKSLGGPGNGGLLAARRAETAAAAAALRDSTSGDPGLAEARRTPCYLEPFAAAFVRAQERAARRLLARYRRAAEIYRRGLADLPLEILGQEGAPHAPATAFIVLCEDREGLRRVLKEGGVEARAPFPEPLHLLPAVASAGAGGGSSPRAERLCRRALALPLGAHVGEDEAALVVSVLRGGLGRL